MQSRKLPVLSVLGVTQTSGLLIGLAALPLIGADALGADKVALAFVGGAAGMGALAAFYTALATGTMSVVAPIAALGVVVPVAAGLAQGEEPAAIQFAGVVLAIAGVVVLSYEEEEEEEAAEAERSRVARRSILLAMIAGLGFGAFFALLDAAATDRPGWAVVSARGGGVAVALGALAVVRPDLSGIPASIGVLVLIGFFDITANALFAVASTRGLLPVVAVGGSMYPAFTVALAHTVLGERLRLPQRIGVAMALGGVVMIAAGS